MLSKVLTSCFAKGLKTMTNEHSTYGDDGRNLGIGFGAGKAAGEGCLDDSCFNWGHGPRFGKGVASGREHGTGKGSGSGCGYGGYGCGYAAENDGSGIGCDYDIRNGNDE